MSSLSFQFLKLFSFNHLILFILHVCAFNLNYVRGCLSFIFCVHVRTQHLSSFGGGGYVISVNVI